MRISTLAITLTTATALGLVITNKAIAADNRNIVPVSSWHPFLSVSGVWTLIERRVMVCNGCFIYRRSKDYHVMPAIVGLLDTSVVT